MDIMQIIQAAQRLNPLTPEESVENLRQTELELKNLSKYRRKKLTAQWREWHAQQDSIFDVIACPGLGKPPHSRTMAEDAHICWYYKSGLNRNPVQSPWANVCDDE